MAVSGPFVVTLYKRPQTGVLGGLFLGFSCISSSIWNIAQAIYGTVFQKTALTCSSSSAMHFNLAVLLEEP
ncbi:hypothetical protein LOK49_LG01G03955 [Camellia lanceoleosa]|uniref:Uncharacterized protein n=1 Tax=Camellia lanceoleosa TaxID=1840588 RepID=A0ACC0IZX1_9ERIC|nr:hypothetical protein LOK49_LG01G03955 [Camellia lanceoleosa]